MSTESERIREQRRRAELTKVNSEFNNPCLKEQKIVYACLNDNAYDYDKCKFQVENYKVCKTFWGTVQKDRRAKGIKPTLPDPEDRESVKKEFLAHTPLF
ncbi:coiled-coil-helix-coiled-coil-helix domain-containing protein 7 [Lycorma delicatula]|uniref:coiled-coil-helix-coiled-coil-helix domain-containing protein 7 n=1 Tax=Lycorma delicatula TaxID=130591 RepID=UPI003F5190FE